MVSFYGGSDPGCVEDANEDSIGWDIERGVWLIADGMGGHSRGELASRVVCDTILDRIASDYSLKKSVSDAHLAVVQAVEDSGDYRSMGSTVVAMQIDDDGGRLVWVGDSRAYLWRKRKLRQISTDHSLLQLLLATRQITEEEARGHPKRNLVTQTLGMGEPEPDERKLELRRRDRIILCSDGLSDELTDIEIARVLKRSGSPKEAVDRLIEAALEHGAKDNVSVIVIECDDDAPARPKFRAHRFWIALSAVAGAVVAFTIVAWLVS